MAYANLTEPGMKHFTSVLLQNCKVLKYEYYNRIFNAIIFVLFVIITCFILYYCKYTKENRIQNEEHQYESKQKHTLRTLQNIQKYKQKIESERISNIPFQTSDYKIFM